MMKITTQMVKAVDSKDVEVKMVDITPEVKPNLVRADMLLKQKKDLEVTLTVQLEKVQGEIAELEDAGVEMPVVSEIGNRMFKI